MTALFKKLNFKEQASIFIAFLFSFFFVTCQEKKPVSQKEVATLCTTRSFASLTATALPDSVRSKTGIGNSHLTISTTNPDAQRWFDEGLNLLHGFWHIEAYRAFKEVIKKDSTCAMGYWGIAMCQPGFGASDQGLWTAAIQKAIQYKTKNNLIEIALIDATDILIKKGIGAEAIDKFRSLYKAFPQEPELIAFAAIILRQHQDPNTATEVKELLENALKKFPNNVALLHYYIHVMELRPDFAKANFAAQQMNKLAPHSPHLVHMPGHLHYLAGDYQKAILAFNEARKQENIYHKNENIPFSINQNYMHNLHYLALAYAELGMKTEALEAAEAYANITMHPSISATDGSAMMLLYEGRILPALVHIRFGEYEKGSEKITFWLNSLDFPLNDEVVKLYLQAMKTYCQGMKAIKEGRVEEATQYGGSMSQMVKQFEQLGIKKQGSPSFKSVNETFDILNMSLYELAGWIDNIDSKKVFVSQAWDLATDLQKSIAYDEPPRLMYPIEESLAHLYKKRGDKKMTQQSKQQAFLKRPKSKMIAGI